MEGQVDAAHVIAGFVVLGGEGTPSVDVLRQIVVLAFKRIGEINSDLQEQSSIKQLAWPEIGRKIMVAYDDPRYSPRKEPNRPWETRLDEKTKVLVKAVFNVDLVFVHSANELVPAAGRRVAVKATPPQPLPLVEKTPAPVVTPAPAVSAAKSVVATPAPAPATTPLPTPVPQPAAAAVTPNNTVVPKVAPPPAAALATDMSPVERLLNDLRAAGGKEDADEIAKIGSLNILRMESPDPLYKFVLSDGKPLPDGQNEQIVTILERPTSIIVEFWKQDGPTVSRSAREYSGGKLIREGTIPYKDWATESPIHARVKHPNDPAPLNSPAGNSGLRTRTSIFPITSPLAGQAGLVTLMAGPGNSVFSAIFLAVIYWFLGNHRQQQAFLSGTQTWLENIPYFSGLNSWRKNMMSYREESILTTGA